MENNQGLDHKIAANDVALEAPKTGLAGLKENFKSDIVSGFMVFLLALPLSLGIAKASGFPAAMGVLTAMIGGLVATWFNVSALTIKGPAAGLITICAGAVAALGGDEGGWQVACAAIMVAAIIQVAFAYLKLGTLSDFFPLSAVHGMLAAIGITIITKQIPVLLGVDPSLYAGKSTFDLIGSIPLFIQAAKSQIVIIGMLALIIMFALPLIGINLLKKIPAPMVVLMVAIPLGLYFDFKSTAPAYSLVTIGDFWGSLGFNFDFSLIGSMVFWKFVFMFLFVGTLESLLTVKATDNLDPYKRASNYNGDLKGLGIANFFSGLLGGLPMISEVVRSSANVDFGAKTKWSNLFHGIFLLIAMLLLIPIIEMIPNAALAAMLIFAGYRLSAPKHFIHMAELGAEELIIFVSTIIATLATDLLVGILVGMLVNLLFHLYHGAKVNKMFKANYTISQKDNSVYIAVEHSATFTNLIAFKKMMDDLPKKAHIHFDITKADIIGHTFMAFLMQYQQDYNYRGGKFEISGFETHRGISAHRLSTRILKKKNINL